MISLHQRFFTATMMARMQFIIFIRVEFHLVWQHLDYFSPERNAALIGVIRNTCVNSSLSGQYSHSHNYSSVHRPCICITEYRDLLLQTAKASAQHLVSNSLCHLFACTLIGQSDKHAAGELYGFYSPGWGEDSYLLPLCRLLLLRSQPAAACCLNKPHITIDSPSVTITLLWNLKLSSHWCIRGKAECHATMLHRANAALYIQLIAHLDRVLRYIGAYIALYIRVSSNRAF